MKLQFVKLHGLGNDFVFIDDMDKTVELSDGQVAHICDRHFGVGGDGVILVRPSDNDGCDAYMHYINSDGTLAQMCGNGVRCFAKYLVDNGLVDSDAGHLTADTLSGPKPIEFTVDTQGRLTQATVDMGEPVLDPQAVPTTLSANCEDGEGRRFAGDAEIDSPWGSFAFTCVSMGNPHAICFIDDFEKLPDGLFATEERSLDTMRLDEIGAFFEANPVFPEKTNVEFAHVEDDGISMRVYERGCGETLACGTGACATNVAAALTGRCGRANVLHLRGGDLNIDWNQDGHVYMTGPAQETFTGTLEI